jgi:hypothetical protein
MNIPDNRLRSVAQNRTYAILPTVGKWRAYSAREIMGALLAPEVVDARFDQFKYWSIKTSFKFGGTYFVYRDLVGFWESRIVIPDQFRNVFIFQAFRCGMIGPAWHRANPGFLPKGQSA